MRFVKSSVLSSIGIGGQLLDGKPHDGRTCYDDWTTELKMATKG